MPSVVENLEALRIAKAAFRESRPLTEQEHATVGLWRGWGALPQAFLPGTDEYALVSEALTADEFRAAAHSTLNAHYTDPIIVKEMWRFLKELGVEDMTGEILEPGCGNGNFFADAPEGVTMVGVELDPITALIAGALHPNATVICDDFAKTDQLQQGTFIASVGNVPFGDYEVYEPIWNPDRYSIHNAFGKKQLELIAVGGIALYITSRHTVESNADKHLEAFHSESDCLGIIRLPGRAHRYAGTDVVTDIMIFQRTHGTRPRRKANPANVIVLGEEIGDRKNGRIGAYEVKLESDLGTALREAFDGILEDFRTPDPVDKVVRTFNPSVDHVQTRVRPDAREGTFQFQGSTLVRYVNGRPEIAVARPKKAQAELETLVRLRDAIRTVLDAQDATPDELNSAQAAALSVYETYVKTFGFLMRHETKTTEDEDGNPEYEFVRPTMGGFRSDPSWAIVGAAEDWDEDHENGKPADVFFKRVAGRRAAPVNVTTVGDAALVAMDRTGEVNPVYVAALLGIEHTDAQAALTNGGHAFFDPATQTWEPAAAYLTGDVRTKMDEAKAAGLEGNVKALADVVPPTVPAGEIDSHPGSPWITEADLKAFLKEICDYHVHSYTVDPWTGRSKLDGYGYGPRGFSTKSITFEKLFSDILNQRQTIITVDVDGREKRSKRLTAEANEAKERILLAFKEWCLADGLRAARISEEYNRRFNCFADPIWDGSSLTFPGLSESVEPWKHQRDAVAWLRHARGGLLAHPVGAGKTLTAIVAAMELKRLGIANRPCIVVPNHLLDQIAAEFYRLYPAGRALIATKDDLSAANRRMFVARAATGDWDLVVMTHSSFGRLPASPASVARYEQYVYDQRIGNGGLAEGSKKQDVKNAEKKRAQAATAAAKAVHDMRGDTYMVNFEQTGIDFLFVDESHLFKKLPNSSASSYNTAGSARARDLHAKVNSLRQRFGRGRLVFMTGTWITNTLAEAWVVQTYLQPDVLVKADVAAFDKWLAAFGRWTEALEMDASGAGYKMKSRLNKFVNVPEMMAMLGTGAHFVHPDDLGFKRPEKIRVTRTIEPDPVLTNFTIELGKRAEACASGSVEPGEDNILKICSDGRKAALDLRLVGLQPSNDTNIKAAVCAKEVLERYTTNLSHPTRILQVVFCDVGIHGEFSVYRELKSLLVAGGIPANRVKTTVEANSDSDKADLFRACRNGHVSVLIASTDKAGLGTNMQDFLYAIHHLDWTWRPDQKEQREGRGDRPGNRNDDLELITYVTERSLDAFGYQTVEYKARMIAPIRYGRSTNRTVDIDDTVALGLAEIKAAAAGNPLLIEKAQLDMEVNALKMSKASHQISESADRAAIADSVANADTYRNRYETLRDLKGTFAAVEAGLAKDHRSKFGDWARDWSGVTNEKLGIRWEMTLTEENLIAAWKTALKQAKRATETAAEWCVRKDTVEFLPWGRDAELDRMLDRQNELNETLGDLAGTKAVVVLDDLEVRLAQAMAGDRACITDPDETVRLAFVQSGRVNGEGIDDLASDVSVTVRLAVAAKISQRTPGALVIAADEDETVRFALADRKSYHSYNFEAAHALFALQLQDVSERVRVAALLNADLESETVERMVAERHAGVTDMLTARCSDIPTSLGEAILAGGWAHDYLTARGALYAEHKLHPVHPCLIAHALSDLELEHRGWRTLAITPSSTLTQALECADRFLTDNDTDEKAVAVWTELLVAHLEERDDERVPALVRHTWERALGGTFKSECVKPIKTLISNGFVPCNAKTLLLGAFAQPVAPKTGWGSSYDRGPTIWDLLTASLSAGLFAVEEWPDVAPYAHNLSEETCLGLPIVGPAVIGRIGRSTGSAPVRVRVARHRNCPPGLLIEWANKTSSKDLLTACMSNDSFPIEELEKLAAHRDPSKVSAAVKALERRAAHIPA
jgi:N12 class adenine-specific DNA methylase